MGRRLPRKDSVSSAGDEDTTGGALQSTAGGGTRRHKQNWRLNMLSVPKQVTAKYIEPEWKLRTGVNADALKAECSERTEQLALSGMRYLKVNKALYTPTHGPEYGKRLDVYIDKSWNSTYNYYRKSMHDLKKKKAEKRKLSHRWSNISTADRRGKRGKYKGGSKIDKKGSKTSQKSKEAEMKEREQWCFERSKPKIVSKPPPVDRGPICDLEVLKQRQDEIAMPKRVYRTPSQDSNFKDPIKVSPAALTYEASERVCMIAQPAQHKLLKTEDIIPGAVKPAALTYEISDRVKELAIPKPATTARESDLNEDAFTISPAALKYVASPRILEIAKPKEYAF